MRTKTFPFYLVVVALFLLIVSPNLLSDGMFMDGLLYATISRNLAEGYGDFWHLFLTETLFPQFNEHPPLAFGLQSIWFRIFGDNMLVERGYSLTTFVITGIVIVKIWGKIIKTKNLHLGWLPLLFWLFIPVISWSACNNMLENTMMIFTSLSVLFILKSFEKNQYLNLFLSGIFIFLAFLTKGFVGLFVLSAPFWIFVFTNKINFKRFCIDTLVLLIASLVPLLLIYFIQPEGIESLTRYINAQVVRSIEKVQTVDYRLWIVVRLLKEFILIGFLVFLVFIMTFKKKFSNSYKNWVLVFLFLGLSGVLPIMVSMKQSGFYMLSAFPFFSISLALLVQERVAYLIQKINYKSIGFQAFKTLSILLFATSLFLVLKNSRNIGRDEARISDVKVISAVVPENTIVSISPELRTEWGLHGYFYRYAKISLDYRNQFQHDFLIVGKKTGGELIAEDYNPIPIKLNSFRLYKRVK